jgi:hypothetical protein
MSLDEKITQLEDQLNDRIESMKEERAKEKV